ncbi:hypothetical protein AK88_04045 [Plasmodium fragile]|uniref:GOLD domain-containing protein n=1 Tax=Plasmodium fragile TaxID=5857 RepID=A0A0D9QKS3_PLAFR|nr:uncharacterized protein AK88_04045 [Plasmodium fragile]KJP86326.1 hypothetical protein AK88_04045 [Plasmodium fragile]
MVGRLTRLAALLVVLTLQCLRIGAIEVYISVRPNKIKCLKERINKDTLVVGKFKTENKSVPISIFIYDTDIHERTFNFQKRLPIFETINEYDIKTAFTTFHVNLGRISPLGRINKEYKKKKKTLCMNCEGGAVEEMLPGDALAEWYLREKRRAIEVYISVRPNKIKCLKERINKDTLVVGKFKTENKSVPISIFIYDTDIHERTFNFQKRLPIFETINEYDIKTAFTTFYSTSYSFCAYNSSNKVLDVLFEIKHGTEARDYAQIAKTEHLNEATIYLKQIVDQMTSFHLNLKRIKASEENEKKASDKLNDTLMWFSLMNILIIIVAAIIQDFYFKRFFTSKKII